MKRFILAFALTVLSGAGFAATMDSVYAEYKADLESPALNPIKGKLAFTPNSISLQQLSEAGRPSAAEKKAIESYVEIRKRYRDGDL